MVQLASACTQCGETYRLEITTSTDTIVCPHCGVSVQTATRPSATGELDRCVVCPSRDLFVRKDFPQRLGVAIVATGFLLSSIAWYYQNFMATYGILFGTALLDVLVFALRGNVLECYACHAQYREASLAEHPPFNLEVHERYRQQQIRMQEAQSAAGPPR